MIEPLPWYLLHAWVLSLPLVMAALLVGRWLMIHLGGRRAREQASQLRLGMGTPLGEPRASHDGKVVALEGDLVVEGDPCAGYADGAPAAACTMHVSQARTWAAGSDMLPHSDRRAERLYLAST